MLTLNSVVISMLSLLFVFNVILRLEAKVNRNKDLHVGDLMRFIHPSRKEILPKRGYRGLVEKFQSLLYLTDKKIDVLRIRAGIQTGKWPKEEFQWIHLCKELISDQKYVILLLMEMNAFSIPAEVTSFHSFLAELRHTVCGKKIDVQEAIQDCIKLESNAERIELFRKIAGLCMAPYLDPVKGFFASLGLSPDAVDNPVQLKEFLGPVVFNIEMILDTVRWNGCVARLRRCIELFVKFTPAEEVTKHLGVLKSFIVQQTSQRKELLRNGIIQAVTGFCNNKPGDVEEAHTRLKDFVLYENLISSPLILALSLDLSYAIGRFIKANNTEAFNVMKKDAVIWTERTTPDKTYVHFTWNDDFTIAQLARVPTFMITKKFTQIPTLEALYSEMLTTLDYDTAQMSEKYKKCISRMIYCTDPDIDELREEARILWPSVSIDKIYCKFCKVFSMLWQEVSPSAFHVVKLPGTLGKLADPDYKTYMEFLRSLLEKNQDLGSVARLLLEHYYPGEKLSRGNLTIA